MFLNHQQSPHQFSFFVTCFILILHTSSLLTLSLFHFPSSSFILFHTIAPFFSSFIPSLIPTFVPFLFLFCRWFHGKITREQAERLLYPPETGLFLVRESTNYPGDYTLCVSCDGKVEHYRIIYHNGKLTIDEEEYFENLMQLVEVRDNSI